MSLLRLLAALLVYLLLPPAALAHVARRGLALALGRRDDAGFEGLLVALLLVAALLREGPGALTAPRRRA